MTESHNIPGDMILKNDGTPYATEAAARSAMVTKGLSDAQYEIESYAEGWAIVKKEEPAPVPPVQAHNDGPVHDKMAPYWILQFSNKVKETDFDDVTLCWEGMNMIFQRQKKVIVPQPFREAADHATYDIFSTVPGELNKVVGTVQRFPYVVLGTSTREEFLAAKRSGDAITAARDKHEAPPPA